MSLFIYDYLFFLNQISLVLLVDLLHNYWKEYKHITFFLYIINYYKNMHILLFVFKYDKYKL